jgi:medium-chain acyl-[acyl-carrier-protein] hydrolase
LRGRFSQNLPLEALMSQPDAWVTVVRPRPQARVRLFCFPYAGGSSVVFHKWSAAMPPHVEVCAVELPGRGKRYGEPLHTNLEELASQIQRELAHWMQAPFALFGHSLGASICYELARRLRRQGGPRPLRLFVSGRHAPHRPLPRAPIYHLPEAQFVSELRRLQGTPQEVLDNAELMELFLPILRADLELAETYRRAAVEPLDCPVSAYGGLQDAEAAREELEHWRGYTAAEFELRQFPGNHFFLNSAQDLVIAAVVRGLDAALENSAA